MKKIIYINKQFRSYDILKYQTLFSNYNALVIWICSFREDDVPSTNLLNKINYITLGFKGSRLQPWNLYINLKLFVNLMRNTNIDLIISSTSDSWHSKISFIIAKLFNIKIVFRKETWYENTRHNPFRIVNRFLTKFIESKSTSILIPGEKQIFFLKQNHNKLPKIYNFPYLIDRKIWNPNRLIKSKPEDKIDFVFWGRIIKLKGVYELIESSVSLNKTYDNFTLTIIGGPTNQKFQNDKYPEYYKKCFDASLKHDFINFKGYIKNNLVPVNIHQKSVFVMPNIKYDNGSYVGDGWGNSLVEALCLGLPIISSDRVGSSLTCVNENINGYIFDSENHKKNLYMAMSKFTAKPEIIRYFSENSIKKSKVVNDSKIILKSLNNILNEK